jgi:hypothetical protein
MIVSRIAAAFVILAVSACTHAPLEPMRMHAFDNLKDEQSYWIKAFEIARESDLPGAKGYPSAYKSCYADEVVRTSTPELHAAVNAFIKVPDTRNSDAISVALGTPHSSMYNARIIVAALKHCEPAYFMAIYDEIRGARSYRDFSLALLRVAGEREGIDPAEFPQDVLDCAVEEYWRALPGDLRQPVDLFLADPSRENWQALYEKFLADGSKDRERTTRLIGACKAKFG